MTLWDASDSKFRNPNNSESQIHGPHPCSLSLPCASRMGTEGWERGWSGSGLKKADPLRFVLTRTRMCRTLQSQLTLEANRASPIQNRKSELRTGPTKASTVRIIRRAKDGPTIKNRKSKI